MPDAVNSSSMPVAALARQAHFPTPEPFACRQAVTVAFMNPAGCGSCTPNVPAFDENLHLLS